MTTKHERRVVTVEFDSKTGNIVESDWTVIGKAKSQRETEISEIKMTESLVQQLRELSRHFGCQATLNGAADHIETLEGAIRQLINAHDIGDLQGEAEGWLAIRKAARYPRHTLGQDNDRPSNRAT